MAASNPLSVDLKEIQAGNCHFSNCVEALEAQNKPRTISESQLKMGMRSLEEFSVFHDLPNGVLAHFVLAWPSQSSGVQTIFRLHAGKFFPWSRVRVE